MKGRHRGSGKLQGKVAIISGGDSGIGRAVAIAFAKEGADLAAIYLEEHKDTQGTEQRVEDGETIVNG
jgi:NAD(P)-dependent dehydrogenase (short-subunit alcohol dehydrogenase family)